MNNKPRKPKKDIYIKLIRYQLKPTRTQFVFPPMVLAEQEVKAERRLIFRKVILEDDLHYYFRNKKMIDSVRRNSVEAFSI
jgi:hypothetical protein